MRSSKGFSLTEVIIGILLTAIIVTSVFSISLTAHRQVKMSDNKVSAGYYAHKLLEQLKDYIAAAQDPGYGPNAGLWNLPGDNCQACSGANCGCAGATSAGAGPGCYALAVGAHDVTATLPASLAGAPSATNPQGLSMRMCYVVSDESGSGDPTLFRPQVQVAVQWTEPST